jgi:class 3 adenylate cyclase
LREQERGAVHERILRAERIRNGRRLAALRAITLAFFVANALVMNLLFDPRGSHLGLVVMTGYFILAVGFWLAVRRSEAVALKAPLIVPFLDVPFAFTLQVITLPYHAPQDVLPSAPALHAVMLFLALVSILSLRTWIVAATAASGLFLALVYATMVGLTALPWISWMIILSGSFAVMALYTLRRLQALVTTAAAEQSRRDRLRRYFSPTVANLLEEQPEGVADTTRVVTVLFSDLRGFTTLTRGMPPDRVVQLLNEVHSALVEEIFRSGGTLDKFMGDGLMAYFNAPLDQPDHASRAVTCAAGMKGALDALNRRRVERQDPPLRLGIGIHTGPATLGTIGTPVRGDYTAVGETVNLASHLEKLTRGLGEGILLTEVTFRLLSPAPGIERTDLAFGGPDHPLVVYRFVPVPAGV